MTTAHQEKMELIKEILLMDNIESQAVVWAECYLGSLSTKDVRDIHNRLFKGDSE